mgnify:CR=1 FL=1
MLTAMVFLVTMIYVLMPKKLSTNSKITTVVLIFYLTINLLQTLTVTAF